MVRTTWLQQQKPGSCGNHFWDNMALGDKKRKPDPFRAEPISPTLVTPSSIKDFFFPFLQLFSVFQRVALLMRWWVLHLSE